MSLNSAQFQTMRGPQVLPQLQNAGGLVQQPGTTGPASPWASIAANAQNRLAGRMGAAGPSNTIAAGYNSSLGPQTHPGPVLPAPTNNPAPQTNTGNTVQPTGLTPGGAYTTGQNDPNNINVSQQLIDSLNNWRGQQVNVSPDILNSMQKYSDAAYNQATSRLDPQWAQQKAAFDQQMVSQGLQPGSQAYNAALQDFNNAKNDAYSQARNQSMQQGLQAQGQAFGQGLAGEQLGLASNSQLFNQGLAGSQLANELAKARLAANAQIQSAHASEAGNIGAANAHAQAAKYGSDNSLLSSLMGDQTSQYLGQLQNELGWGNLGLGAGQLGLQQNNQDFNQMMGLYGAGNQATMYNNAIPGMEMGNIGQLLGMIPNSNPALVDVTGAYGLNAGMQNNAYQGDVASNNAQNSTYGALGSAAIMAAMML